MNNSFSQNTVASGKSRFILPLLVILFLILLPTGCNTVSTGDKDEDEMFMEKYEAPDKKLEHAAIKFYFPGQQPKNWNEVQSKIEEQISSTINVSLDFKWLEYQNYMQKMSVLDASDEPFDAFCLGKPQQYYLDFSKLAREGKLKDITQLFTINAPSLMKKYTEEELNYARVDGNLYAIPSLYPHAYCTYLMVDDALLKKYNISNISNYEQYEAYLRAVKENEPDLIPGTIANGIDTLSLFARASGYVIVDEMQKLVYKWDDPKMKVVAWEKTPEFKEAVNYIANWFKEGYLVAYPDQMKTTSFIYYGMLNPPHEETTKMTFSSSGKITESNPLRIFYLYPENQVQRDNPMGSFYFNGSFVFPASSTNTERALQFLDWVQQSRNNYFLTMYGIEGKDYVLKNNYPTLPEGMDFNNRTYLHWDGSWTFSNIEYFPILKDENGNEIEGPKKFLDKNSKYPPHGALYPNYSSIDSTASSRSGAFMEFEGKISMGRLIDSSEIDDFIKKLEDLGTANLVEVVQKQLDNAVKSRDGNN